MAIHKHVARGRSFHIQVNAHVEIGGPTAWEARVFEEVAAELLEVHSAEVDAGSPEDALRRARAAIDRLFEMEIP